MFVVYLTVRLCALYDFYCLKVDEGGALIKMEMEREQSNNFCVILPVQERLAFLPYFVLLT